MISSGLLVAFIIVIAILIVAAISLILFFVFKKEESTGKPVALNFAVPYATPQHMIFQEKKCEAGPDGRFRVTLVPKDIDINKKDLKIEEYQIVLGRDRRVEIGNLGFGAERNTYIYEPRNALELPTSLRKTILGKAIVKDLEEKTIEDSVLMAHQKIEAMNGKILSSLPTTVSEASMELHKSLLEMAKAAPTKKDEKTKKPFSPWGFRQEG